MPTITRRPIWEVPILLYNKSKILEKMKQESIISSIHQSWLLNIVFSTYLAIGLLEMLQHVRLPFKCNGMKILEEKSIE